MKEEKWLRGLQPIAFVGRAFWDKLSSARDVTDIEDPKLPITFELSVEFGTRYMKVMAPHFPFAHESEIPYLPPYCCGKVISLELNFDSGRLAPSSLPGSRGSAHDAAKKFPDTRGCDLLRIRGRVWRRRFGYGRREPTATVRARVHIDLVSRECHARTRRRRPNRPGISRGPERFCGICIRHSRRVTERRDCFTEFSLSDARGSGNVYAVGIQHGSNRAGIRRSSRRFRHP